MGKLLLQAARRPPFYLLHQAGWAHGWRSRSEHVHVILAHLPFFDPNIQTETRLSDRLQCSMDNLPFQNVKSVLYHLYQVVLDLIDRMESVPVWTHRDWGEVRLPWRARSPEDNS